jgi:predicted transcriptional regulator
MFTRPGKVLYIVISSSAFILHFTSTIHPSHPHLFVHLKHPLLL